MAIFIERLNIQGLIIILPNLLKLPKQSSVFYFDHQWLPLMIWRLALSLHGYQLKQLEFEIIDVHDKQGNSVQHKVLYQELLRLREMIRPHLAQQLASYSKDRRFDFCLKEYVAHYDMISEGKYHQLWHVLNMIHIALWYGAKDKMGCNGITLAVYQRPWMNVLSTYAKEFDIAILNIGPKASYAIIARGKKFLKHVNLRRVQSLARYFFYRLRKLSPSSFQDSRCWVDYTGQFNLDKPNCHSDTFFLHGSKLQGKDIQMAFSLSVDPLTDNIHDTMQKNGIRGIVLNPQATSISLEKEMFIQANGTGSYQGIDANYQQQCERWRTLFAKTNSRFHISWYKYDASHMAIADAMRSLNGVAAIYQRAFEPNACAQTQVNTDVIFGCSSDLSYGIEKDSGSKTSHHIAVGYIGDYRFSALKKGISAQIRHRLHEGGAKYIIAFFDENTLDDGRWFMGHSFTQKNYESMLKYFLNDPNLGLVIKPKKPSNLRMRLGKVSDLLDEAISTKRCIIFDQGYIQGAYPPAAAALAADIAIHECLSAATAGVESALAGVPTLLLDEESWPFSPLYALGNDVVLRDWDSLYGKLDYYRSQVQHTKILQAWEPLLKRIDSFRDGQSSLRVGDFIHDVLDALRQGLPREQALDMAVQAYGKRWGMDKVKSL